MSGKDYISFLNVAGAVSSILALVLTLSQNVTIAFVIKSLVAIVSFIATTGTLGALAHRLNKVLVTTDYWPYHLLYWLVLGMAIIFASLVISSIGYMLTTLLIDLFISFIDSINKGYI